MKKAVSLLLVFALCLSFCACGGKSDAPVKEEETREENYEVTETEPVIIEAEPQTVTIELSMDNWQEYFEFVDYVEWNKNAFGEIESFSSAGLAFQMKEEYQSRLVSMSNGAVEWQYYTAIVGCNFNTATKECTLIDTYAVGDHLFSNTRSLSASGERIGWAKYFEAVTGGTGELATMKEIYGVAGNYEKALFGYPVNIEIVRIQGTLTFTN